MSLSYWFGLIWKPADVSKLSKHSRESTKRSYNLQSISSNHLATFAKFNFSKYSELPKIRFSKLWWATLSVFRSKQRMVWYSLFLLPSCEIIVKAGCAEKINRPQWERNQCLGHPAQKQDIIKPSRDGDGVLHRSRPVNPRHTIWTWTTLCIMSWMQHNTHSSIDESHPQGVTIDTHFSKFDHSC